jgi:hypothetical protein
MCSKHSSETILTYPRKNLDCYSDREEVIDFIKRRFKKDCDWTCGNCYYFAVILKARFPKGTIYYDVVDGHFVFAYQGELYDYTGVIHKTMRLVEWNKFDDYDSNQKQVIVRDCIL